MNRRSVLPAFTAMLVGAPPAKAQQRPKRIGLLRPGAPDSGRLAAFKLGMREQGYVEGRDYELVIREGRGIEHLAKMADELVAMKVDAIFVGGTPSAQAAARATRDIPIFISSVNDPVAAGLVSSLARPGTNITASIQAGGLLSYSPDVNDQTRRVAGHVSKVFKGAKPAELPIEQPTRFELVLNLKTAKALGITIPQSVLLQASRVIE